MGMGKFHPHEPGFMIKGLTGSKELVSAGAAPNFVGTPKMLLDLQTADGNPRTITVGMFLRPIDDNNGIPPKCKAVITFGAGSAPMKCEIDFINGTIFRVPCDHLRLEAMHEDPTNVTDGRVFAFASYDPISNGRNAQRTIHIPLIGVGAQFPVAPDFQIIPEGAVSVRFLPAPKGSTYTLHFLRVGGPGGVDLYDVTVPAGGLPPEVPISNWAKFMRIENEGAIISQGELIFSFPF